MLDNSAASVTIHRVEYTPPAFAIDKVELEFDLSPLSTTVTNRMQIHRVPGAATRDLVLHGADLELVSAEIDGRPWTEVQASGDGLTVSNVPATPFELTLVTLTHPSENTSLSGLYVSNHNFFTQCEAEGFRRITYFLDRPDVMTTFTVTLRAPRAEYPVLLSNGNLVETGELPDGRHFATWHDPFPKPSYLFALVAGKLAAREQRIKIRSGEEKLLQVWVEPHDLPKTEYAMQSLVHSIEWDEERFGLPLDLERFMIVAVSDFNMGAMENKGLNIFNTKYVLADAETATDVDFGGIEAVVGHEYFHNWTGNRVTCRDWFQLSLKEGLTVFRDQEFSADMAAAGGTPEAAAAARASRRIDDVRGLRQNQFAEDAGPMAHPVRPDSYVEINNFYTMTVYEKGAEVVRMYQTLFGRDGFRKGMDLYFARHDGQAVTCDDFRAAMADANQRDLAQFERWYSQAGTPHVAVTSHYDAAARTFDLTLVQSYGPSSAAAKATQKGPLLIPFAVGLVGSDGKDLPLRLAQDGQALAGAPTTRVLELTDTEQTFRFVDVAEAPLPSLLRNFSAPVIVSYDYTDEQLTFLFAHDSDPFNRWEAGQRLATRALLSLADAAARNEALSLDPAIVAAFGRVLRDSTLAPAFRELALTLPSESYLAEQMDAADPAAVHAARLFFRRALANGLRDDLMAAYDQNRVEGPYEPSAADAGRRGLKNVALSYLADLDDPADTAELARAQYDGADNMTDRSAALMTLLQIGRSDARGPLDDFYRRFEKEALALDKWFGMQATRRGAPGERVLDDVRALMAHPAFSLKNPNRARALIFQFCMGNAAQFHAADGSGYAFWAEQVLALDTMNPQVASRLARSLEQWRKFTPVLREKMRAALEHVAQGVQSKDVREVVEKALAG